MSGVDDPILAEVAALLRDRPPRRAYSEPLENYLRRGGTITRCPPAAAGELPLSRVADLRAVNDRTFKQAKATQRAWARHHA